MARVKALLKGINRSKLNNNAEFIDCQELINLRYKNQKWQNVKGKKTYKTIGDNVSCFYYHNTIHGKHLIVYESDYIRYVGDSSYQNIFTISLDLDVRFESMGNILIVFDDTNRLMHYILWDVETTTYRYIGDALPEKLDINFKAYRDDYTYLNEHSITLSNTFSGFISQSISYYDNLLPLGLFNPDTSNNERYEQIQNILSKKIAEWEKSGRVCGVVCIRYAYELFDGSIICHSEPHLVYIRGFLTDQYSTFDNLEMYYNSIGEYVRIAMNSAQLMFSIPSNNMSRINTLSEKFKGIVKGINIYMSRAYNPFHAYNFLNDKAADDLINSIENHFNINIGNTADVLTGLPSDARITTNMVAKDSMLYKILHIPLDKIEVSTQLMDLGDVTTLHTREVMPTEQISISKIHANRSYFYNSRLFLGVIKSYLPKPTDPTLHSLTYWNGTDSVLKGVIYEFIIKTQDGDKVVRSNTFNTYNTHHYLPICISYPDSRAYKFNILVVIDGVTYIAFRAYLEPHPTFNMAFCIIGDLSDLHNIPPSTTDLNNAPNTRSSDWVRLGRVSNDMYAFTYECAWKIPSVATGLEVLGYTEKNTVIDNNRIQATEVNNPFYFPAKNSYRVGNGEIKAIASNTRPLSSLQYGQHPLVVFTDGGIFALEIGIGEVLVQRIFPISDEVIINNQAVTYNGSIIFATSKGVMALSGDRIDRISKEVDGDSSNILSGTHYAWIISDLFGSTPMVSDIDFLTYLQSSILGVDYTNEELIVANEFKNYSYVYNFESGMWSKRSESFKKFVNDWPITYATMIRNSRTVIVKLGEEDDTLNLPVLLISRMCGFGLNNEKKIERMILRLNIKNNTGRISTLVYGLLKEDGQLFLNNAKSKELTETNDFYILNTYRSSRYTVLVFGCKPDTLLFDCIEAEIKETWKV